MEEFDESFEPVTAESSIDGYEEEYFFTCPYCWKKISALLDLSVQKQNYVEDCEVCCNPIQISFIVRESIVEDFTAVSPDE